jgi:hypothetical protein
MAPKSAVLFTSVEISFLFAAPPLINGLIPTHGSSLYEHLERYREDRKHGRVKAPIRDGYQCSNAAGNETHAPTSSPWSATKAWKYCMYMRELAMSVDHEHLRALAEVVTG